jgi:hypothetical protein
MSATTTRILQTVEENDAAIYKEAVPPSVVLLGRFGLEMVKASGSWWRRLVWFTRLCDELIYIDIEKLYESNIWHPLIFTDPSAKSLEAFC